MSDNTVKQITIDNLRHMDGKEGLVLQGCGGDLQEWLDGINSMLTEDGILLDGSRFESVSVFQHDGLTNLLFSFEGVELDMGKLAMWRLQTHGRFGGTWLPAYGKIPQTNEGGLAIWRLWYWDSGLLWWTTPPCFWLSTMESAAAVPARR